MTFIYLLKILVKFTKLKLT